MSSECAVVAEADVREAVGKLAAFHGSAELARRALFERLKATFSDHLPVVSGFY